MRAHRPRVWVAALSLAGGLFLTLGGSLSAQQAAPPQPPATTPAAAEELTAEAIHTGLQQVTDAAELDEATKAQAKDLYQKALEQLRLADEWAAKAADFEAARQEAPTRLETIKAELAEPAPEPVPQIPADATLSQLEQLLTQTEAELAAAQKQTADLDTELKRRGDRRLQAPKQVADAQQRLAQVTQELTAPTPAEEPTALTQARRALSLTRKQATEQEIAAYEKEILSYDARGELLRARRDQAARCLSQAEKLTKAWRDVVAERRRVEAERAAREAEEARQAAASAHPAVRRLAEGNAELADRRTQLAKSIEQTSKELEQTTATRDTVGSSAQSVRDKIKAVGVTEAISVLLRKQRASLPDIRQHRSRIRAGQSEISRVQLQLLELDEERAALADIDQQLQEVLQGLEPAVSQAERADIEATARSLLQTRRDYVESLYSDLDSYFSKLVDLDDVERQLVSETRQFAQEIDENILWFRSTSPLRPGDLSRSYQALRWLTAPRQWSAVLRVLGTDGRAHWMLHGVALAAFAAWLLLQRRLRTRLRELATLTRSASTDSFGCTVSAFVTTVVIAVGLPAAAGFVAWRLWWAAEASEFAKAQAIGLRTAAVFLLMTELLRQSCRKRGLTQVHFQWPRGGLKIVRTNLIWLMAVVIPTGFIVSVMEWQEENEVWRDSLGRLALMVALVSLALFAQRVLRPSGQLMGDFLRRNQGGWLDRLRHVWYVLAFGVPLALAVGAGVGYQYTAQQLAGRLVTSLWLVLGLTYANAFMLRWLFVLRRRLALEKAKERLEAEADEEPTREATGEGVVEQVEEPEVSIFSISAQTQQLVRSFVGVALIIGLWLIWADVLPALGLLKRVELWATGPEEYVTLASLALALLIVVMTVAAAKNIPGLLEMTILQRLPLDHGVRYAIAAVARYLITAIGVIVAFWAIGIGWSKVQWLVAAMTVGLGFGLQEIFGNFISGLIILFERPMRVGDTVTVGDVTGTVTRIQIRATTIRDWDRRELVVPNKEFITGKLVNWTLSDTVIRVVIPVGIAYGSDTHLAQELLLKVAREHSRVLADPAPMALFLAFGESSLDFELRVFIPSMEYFLQVRHDLQMAIDDAFRQARIEIAFPQHDVHLHTAEPALPATEKRADQG